MVQELLPFIPQALTTPQAVVCIALMSAGLFLWLAGAVWGRAILTLAAVAVGATLGMFVPRWQAWPINSMSAAVLGAVCFGVSAFLVERIWCAILLGIVLTAWATLGVWMTYHGEQPFPQWDQEEMQQLTPPQQARELWFRLPEHVRRVLPFAAATMVVSAMAIALLWPRVAKVSAFSTLGVTMLFVATLTLVASRRPDWLLLVPEQLSIQAAVLGVMALFGVVVQWQLLPSNRRVAEEKRDEKRIEEASTTDFSRGKFV